MRLVITGAAGFIGSVLTVRAAERGYDVLALDDLSRGLNHPHLFGGRRFRGSIGVDDAARIRALRHDCAGGFAETVPEAWASAGPAAAPLAVVHLAAGTGSLDRPLRELRALNVEMTQRVWQDARDLGARVFVFPTTSLALAVPDSPYVQSKEEALAWLLAQDDRPQRIPLRFFNVAGAYKGRSERRQHEVHLIPTLVDCYRAGKALVINGDDYPETEDGTPGRDFVHVVDVADTILALIERAVTESGPRLQPNGDGAIWLGTGQVTSTLGVVRIFSQWIGTLRYEIGPRRAFDCGALRCAPHCVGAIERLLGRGLAPAWVSIRDEATELLNFPGPRAAPAARP